MIIESLKARVIIVILSIVGALIYIIPNFVNVDNIWWPTKTRLNYGLDIQGGLHLVLGVDVNGVITEKTARLARSLKSEFAEKQIGVTSIEPTGPNGSELQIVLASADQAPVLEKFLEERYSTTLQVLETSGTTVRLQYYTAAMQEYQKQIVQQAIEVIRNRIDQFGVAEPSISAQGSDRIIVQLPGIQNAAAAKDLINRTARLSFNLISTEMTSAQVDALVTKAETEGGFSLGKDDLRYTEYFKKINEALKGQLPANTAVAFEKLENAATLEAGKRAYLIRTDTDLGGDQLEDSFVSQGERGEPEVVFKFDSMGRVRMGQVTGENIGKPLGILLDDVIQSAPVIQSKITDQGRITLNQRNYDEALAEANLISTALRAGALPASLTQLEERTVGPTLGADSIRKGNIAGAVGLALIMIFMLINYRKLGVVANIALIVNLILLLAILSSLGATLTLPGIAGVVLTLGMAVDASVIIFERIKEELAKGSGAKSAVRDGFAHAFSAIFDGSLTTAITSVVLMYFGTGPVRGFAITLLIGLITSMFTAIFVSRVVLDIMVNKMGVKNIVKVRAGGVA